MALVKIFGFSRKREILRNDATIAQLDKTKFNNQYGVSTFVFPTEVDKVNTTIPVLVENNDGNLYLRDGNVGLYDGNIA